MRLSTLITGFGLGVLALSGCSSVSFTELPEKEYNQGPFYEGNKTIYYGCNVPHKDRFKKLKGAWQKTNENNGCVSENKKSRKYQIVFDKYDNCYQTAKENIKDYNSSGCKEEDLVEDYTYTYHLWINQSRFQTGIKKVFTGSITRVDFVSHQGTFDGNDGNNTVRGIAIRFNTCDRIVVKYGNYGDIADNSVNKIHFTKDDELVKNKSEQ